ncbi:MAG: FmdB family zinc ribbon protein [Opitutaceae bacterium]
MPTYEYACQKCEHTFEQFQSMRDDPLVRCPKCGKKSLKRLLGGGSGLIFKGSGFYITDYRKGGAAKSGESKGGEAKPAGGSS